jgi:hypothetical protein
MSNLVIEVLSASVSTHPGKTGNYQVCELAFKNKSFQDKVEGKKIMSFAEKNAFETLKGASMGQVFTIVRQKDDKGYWKWVDVQSGEVSNMSTPSASQATQATPAKTTPKSTYETPEERAARQVMIVRQSSISSAVALAAASSKTKVTPEEIIEVAKQFEAYVMGISKDVAVTAIQSLIDLTDDIPE